MRCILITLITILTTIITPLRSDAQRFVVADATERFPLGGASILTPGGAVSGITDIEGVYREPFTLPIRVSCPGYEEATVTAATDTVFLTPHNYQLSEVVIEPVDRPVMRLNCYVREYCTISFGTDTILMVGEYMADFFMTEKKVKGFSHGDTFPDITVRKRRKEHRNAAGLDSISKSGRDDEFLSWAPLFTLNPQKFTVTDSLAAGVPEIKQGKYGPLSATRLSDDRLVIETDALANKKDHHYSPWFLKLIGFTIDATQMHGRSIYLVNERGEYGPATLQMSSKTIEMTINSKWVKRELHTKEPVKSYSIVEIYPVGIEYLTPEEAKEARENPSQTEIVRPPMAPAFVPEIQRVMDYNPED